MRLAAHHLLLPTLALVCTGCGTSVASYTQGPAWDRAAAWSELSRLPGYAYSSSMLEGYDLQAQLIQQSGTYLGPQSYASEFDGRSAGWAFLGVTKLVDLGGRYYGYIAHPAAHSGFQVGWYDFGSIQPSSAYQNILTGFGQLSDLWTQRLGATTGEAVGSCSVAGRPGTEFSVTFHLPPDVGVKQGKGTACLDDQTGAALRVDFTLHATDGAGSPVVFEDRLALAKVGGIPPITAPAGAREAPPVTTLP